jgi:hypothetical protein
MQDKIETYSNFSSNTKEDPMKLFKAIKELTLNYEDLVYKMTIVLDSICALLNAKE